MRKTLAQFSRFASVGAIGFIVDAGTLTLLIREWAWGPFVGRVVSFPLAVTTTWALNRSFVFEDRTAAATGRSYARYLAVQLTGAAVNWCVFGLLVVSVPPWGAQPALPLGIAAIAGLVVNYAGSRWWVFGTKASTP